jgi:hypothetical protein
LEIVRREFPTVPIEEVIERGSEANITAICREELLGREYRVRGGLAAEVREQGSRGAAKHPSETICV